MSDELVPHRLAGISPKAYEHPADRAAVEHYTDRFRAIFREAGEGVGKAGDRLSDWLKGADKDR